MLELRPTWEHCNKPLPPDSLEARIRTCVDMWLFKHIDVRSDNLICAAVIEQDAIIVKTVMINWELEDGI